LLQIQYRKDRDNKSQIVSVKTVSALSSSMQLSEIDVNDSTTFYNVSVPLTLLEMDSYKKVLSAVNASFHSKYPEVTGFGLLSDIATVRASRYICLIITFFQF